MRKLPDDHMSPDASPGGRSAGVGVRRVNNRPVYIVGGTMMAFLLVMAAVAFDRAKQQDRPAKQAESQGGDAMMFAREIAGEQEDGVIQAASAAPPVPPVAPAAANPTGGLLIARPTDLDLPPKPPTSSQSQPGQVPRSARDEDAERIRMMKMQQFDEAVKAKTSIQTAAPRSAGSSQGAGATTSSAGASREEALARLAEVRQQIEESTRDDPTASYKARLQQIQAPATGGAAGPQLVPSGASRSGIGQQTGAVQNDRWRLDAKPEVPRSAFELRAGFVIPALLISGINSELPGQIVAQVSQDVYDTPLGKWKLIPQGSRLIGSYTSEVAYGQSRILIAWQRIIFPDGKAMDIGAMPGADGAGYAGLKDQVNSHYFRLFSSAFLMSGVTAGIALSQPNTGNFNSRPTASSAMSEGLGQQLGQVTAQLIAKNLNIAPTLEIRPGYRFNVIVTKDMAFSKPYQAFDY